MAASRNMQAAKGGEAEESGNKYQFKEGEYVNVVDLSDNKELAERIAGSSKSRITVIRDYLFEMLGGEEITMSDGIKAVIDKSDAKHIANRARSGRQTAEVSGIKDIIKNAKFYNKVETDHKKYTAFRYYETPVKYGNDILFVTVNLGMGRIDNEYHIYDLTEPKERNASSRINGSGRLVSIALGSGVPVDSIAQGALTSQELSKKYQYRNVSEINADIEKNNEERLALQKEQTEYIGKKNRSIAYMPGVSLGPTSKTTAGTAFANYNTPSSPVSQEGNNKKQYRSSSMPSDIDILIEASEEVDFRIMISQNCIVKFSYFIMRFCYIDYKKFPTVKRSGIFPLR